MVPSFSISEARAIELARQHTTLSTVVSATTGRFGDVNSDPNIGPGYPIKADDIVWAVKFSGEISICNPLGVCESPRPSLTTVYLDFATGTFLTSDTFSPAN